MTVHISARLAWHQDGWNGRICDDPAANVETSRIGPTISKYINRAGYHRACEQSNAPNEPRRPSASALLGC